MSEKKVVFISGGNRGIGHEMAQAFSKKSCQVVVGYRHENNSAQLLEEAQKSDNLFPFQVEVTAEKDLNALADFIAQKFGHLDILVNNAGVFLNRSQRMHDLAWTEIAHHLDVNIGSVFLTTRCLYPLLQKGNDKKVINISSQMGSIELCAGGGLPYRISKAGLNMLTKNQAIEYRRDGVSVVSLHPGWVRTDMGGSNADLSVQEAVSHLVKVIETISPEQSGQLLNFNGEVLPY